MTVLNLHNMKLGDMCCTFQQAQRLTQLGVQQDTSYFVWVCWTNPAESNGLIVNREHTEDAVHRFDAFSVSELGIMLPRNYASFFCGFDLWRIANTFHYAENYTALHGAVAYTGQLTTFTNITGSSEAEVRASLLIFLIEKKIYSVDNVNASLNLWMAPDQEEEGGMANPYDMTDPEY